MDVRVDACGVLHVKNRSSAPCHATVALPAEAQRPTTCVFAAARAYATFEVPADTFGRASRVVCLDLRNDMRVCLTGATRIDILRVWVRAKDAVLDLYAWQGVASLKILELNVQAVAADGEPQDQLSPVVHLDYAALRCAVLISYAVAPGSPVIYTARKPPANIIVRPPVTAPEHWDVLDSLGVLLVYRLAPHLIKKLPYPLTPALGRANLCYLEETCQSNTARNLGRELPGVFDDAEGHLDHLLKFYEKCRPVIRQCSNTPHPLCMPVRNGACNTPNGSPRSPLEASLPAVNGDNGGGVCSICLEAMHETPVVTAWACEHSIHTGCHARFCAAGAPARCPVCRTQ